jgi:hypothetical protein
MDIPIFLNKSLYSLYRAFTRFEVLTHVKDTIHPTKGIGVVAGLSKLPFDDMQAFLQKICLV